MEENIKKNNQEALQEKKQTKGDSPIKDSPVSEKKHNKKMNLSGTNAVLIVLIIAIGGLIFLQNSDYTIMRKSEIRSLANTPEENSEDELKQLAELEEVVIPKKGFEIPIEWGDLGKKMIDAGVIDKEKFEEIYAKRGGLTESEKKLVYGNFEQNLRIDSENSGLILNLLWALGLGNKNEILEKGPMTDPKYKGAGSFASTGGWSIAEGDPMNHYSKHKFIVLSTNQQAMVEKVSKGIYRPCCGNSTHFPDCNHGMAMLGLLELMASQGVSEKDMYDVALQVNAYWFPDTYLTLAKFEKENGIEWKDVDAQKILGENYSSASGYQRILKKIGPARPSQGGSCSV